MKTNRLLTIFISLLLLNAHAVFAQNTYVPDDNFEQALIDMGYDSGELNDSVPTGSIQSVKNLYINSQNISDLTGIEDFESLEILDCAENNIDSLDVQQNKNLKSLDCTSNKITNLNVSENLELIFLYCGLNQLTILDVSHNSSLAVLWCYYNNLTSLNLESNLALKEVFCHQNKIEELDVSKNVNLEDIWCYANNLRRLNLKNGNNYFMGVKANLNPDLFCIQVDNPEESLTYEDWAKDENASYSENCLLDQTNIPLSEYNSLVELYNSTLGEEWLNNENWLDTVNSSVNDWYGITVTNGHVTRIELPDNNLQEGAFENPLQLSELEVLDLSGNNLLDANFSNLDSLSKLTSLHIENNSFIFKHIIEIFNSPIYNNISGNFTYSPQDKIDFTEELELTPGDILEMSIDPVFISSGDLLQWYKDGLPLEGETEFFYDKTNLTVNDSGTYYLLVTNPDVAELTLQSHNKHVTVKDLVGGIPHLEYEALVAFYNSTNGDNWTNNTNWLDTTNHSVVDWYGITVENGHVSVIDLYNNNLYGEIPGTLANLSKLKTLGLNRNRLYGPIPVSFKNLTELQILALEYNSLGPVFIDGNTSQERAIPDELSDLESLFYLSIKSNKFFFNDIETVKSWSLSNFIYEYQYPFGDTNKSIFLEPGADYTLQLENYLAGEHDFYQWTKNGNPIPGANNSILELTNLQLTDEAVYRCQITNSLVEDLTILNAPVTIQVNGVHGAGVPLSEYKALEKFYTVNNGENWKWNENWLDTVTCTVGEWAGVRVENGHVRMLGMDSTNVAGVLPEELTDLIFLEEFYVFDNNITGTLPAWIGELTHLERLHLGNNNLTGEIPASIGQLKKLKSLELSRNRLDGDIPSEIGNDTNLVYLALDNNNLTGPIAEEIGNLKNLRHLILEHNGLSGTIPGSLGNLTNLFTLDLSHNQLTGPLPVELKKLENIYRFDIDYNLLGEIDLNKSAVVDNNRQIPDELASLLQMDTLYLGGNQLQFNDIEAIFSWENYNSFNEFIYAPQDSIGVPTTQQASPGENLILSIENYFAGPSDRYQWFKYGNIIPGATSATLALNGLQLSDAGKYYCKITNPVATELTLYSRAISVQVTEEIKGAGVPLSEYEALVAIYNETNGPAWINNENWLDTTNHSVDDWFGITVENNHVTGFKMPNNNLSFISGYLNSLTKLKVIDLSEGNFVGEVPVLENLSQLDTLNLSTNKFTFKDLVAITGWNNYSNFETNFIYSPQAKVGESERLYFHAGDTMNLNIKNYEPDVNDHFEWYRNQTAIPESNTEQLKRVATEDDYAVNFFCKITNPNLTELTLISEKILTYVTISSADSLLLFQLTLTYPQLLEIWNYNVPFSSWPGVTFENGKVTALDLSGLDLEGDISPYFADFDSLKWLNLSDNNFSGPFTSLFEKSALKNSIVAEESTLEYLNIKNNKFTFADLEPTVNELSSVNDFIYAPQSVIGQSIDTTVYKNQNIELTLNNYTPGESDDFIWYKDGVEISGENQLTLIIESAALADSGKYTCQVTNSLFPDLTLFSDTIKLSVLIPDGIDEFGMEDISVYPNPGEQQIFVETGNKQVNIKIFDLAGILVLEKKDFQSAWIEIQSFVPSIYLFRIEDENSEVINKKIIFK